MGGTARLSFLGIGTIAFGLLVLLVAIPYGVTSPSNVQTLVLSPLFWPTIVAWLMIILGALHMALHALQPSRARDDKPDAAAVEADREATPAVPLHGGAVGGATRLAAASAIMVTLVLATPTVGLVWTTMIAFALISLIIRTSSPLISLVVAVALPLILYAFFNHVAGVAVPQGNFIRLP
ncbi:MAG: tripartite tricarboxylate transporter TctB family protein [Pseudomonadota bacterium]